MEIYDGVVMENQMERHMENTMEAPTSVFRIARAQGLNQDIEWIEEVLELAVQIVNPKRLKLQTTAKYLLRRCRGPEVKMFPFAVPLSLQ